MPRISHGKRFALETLESRLTPTGLNLALPDLHLPALPAPASALMGAEGLQLPKVSLSLQLPSLGQPGLGLRLEAGLVSLNAGVLSGGGLLSIGVKLDPAALPPLLGLNLGAVLPSLGVSVGPVLPPIGGMPPVETVPLPAPAPVPGLPPIAMPPLTPEAPLAPTLGAPTTPRSADASTSAVPTEQAQVVPTFLAVAEEGSEVSPPPTARVTPAPYLAVAARGEQATPPAAVAGEALSDQAFDLRDGPLAEDFGIDVGADGGSATADADGVSAPADEALSAWLLLALAGCAGGAAWLSRRGEREQAALDVDPRLGVAG